MLSTELSYSTSAYCFNYLTSTKSFFPILTFQMTEIEQQIHAVLNAAFQCIYENAFTPFL